MNKSFYPCLWFDGNAKQAADFYCSLFNNTRILQSNPMVTTFQLNGTKFMGLNGGPQYKLTQAVSFFVYCGGDESEINRLYAELSKGGKVIWPLDKYEWSPRYAWVEDKFGVNWQLDVESINNEQKMVPCLLFVNEKFTKVKEAMTHYTSIFINSKILMEAPYPPSANLPQGTLLFAQFKLNDFIFNAMSSTMHHDFDFTPGTSFVVECDTQKEIDYYWDNLGAGGHYSMCGWLQDKFGVSWQIVPKVLGELMSDPQRAPRVTKAFMQMQKFDIDALLRA